METETGDNGEREREKMKEKLFFELQNSFMRHTPHSCLQKRKENKEAELVSLHSVKLNLYILKKLDDGSIQLLYNQLMRRLRSASKISK